MYLREWAETGESKIMNALLCKLPFLCEVCAVRRQAKMFAASVPKVKHVMKEDPTLRPFMITFGVKTGPDLDHQFEHFTTSRKKYMEAVRRG